LASWFTITLDTSPPTAEIFLPNISSPESVETITVVGNENLDIRHEFYAIDSANVRHDFTFTLQEDKRTFIGQVPFNQFSEGMVKFFFIIYDDVLNRSMLYVKNVALGENIGVSSDVLLSDSTLVTLELTDIGMELILLDE